MLGIFFGVICTIALFKVLRGRRYWGHHGRYGGHRGYGRRFFLRRLFQRLNTGPGQEKVVLTEMDAMHDTLHALRAELKGTRGDIAAILRDPTFDRSKLEALFRKQDEILAKLREAASGSIERVHAALDERQKGTLANLVERGFRSAIYSF